MFLRYPSPSKVVLTGPKPYSEKDESELAHFQEFRSYNQLRQLCEPVCDTGPLMFILAFVDHVVLEVKASETFTCGEYPDQLTNDE